MKIYAWQEVVLQEDRPNEAGGRTVSSGAGMEDLKEYVDFAELPPARAK